MNDTSNADLQRRALEHANWSHALAPTRPPKPAPRADSPEWVRFAVFYIAVFVVLGGWVSALRALIDILRETGMLR